MQRYLMSVRMQLLEKKEELIEQLSEYPQETIFVCRNGKYRKYYLANGKNPIYIPKKEKEKIEKYVIKKYLQEYLEETIQQIKTIEIALEALEKIQSPEEMLDEASPYYEYIYQYFSKSNEQVEKWINTEYVRSTNYSEHLKYKTYKGDMVRSKSEVIIANALYRNKIPYRYECGKMMNGETFYPDFTILHAMKKKLIYWEHLGLMEKSSYRSDLIYKLGVYGDNEIYLGVNLIVTGETPQDPLDSLKIEQIIRNEFM